LKSRVTEREKKRREVGRKRGRQREEWREGGKERDSFHPLVCFPNGHNR